MIKFALPAMWRLNCLGFSWAGGYQLGSMGDKLNMSIRKEGEKGREDDGVVYSLHNWMDGDVIIEVADTS